MVIFPLTLTYLEELMLRDDRPAYPLTGVFRLRFSGFLDRSAFAAAVANTVRRHPLLRATVRRTRFRRPQWIDHPDWCPSIEWHAETNRHGFPCAGHMDLTQHPGVRFWVVDRDDGHDVIAQVHHSCSDAIGMSSVLEELLIGYAMESGGSGVSLPELDPRRLLGRGAPGLTAWKFLKMARKQAVGLHGVREFLQHSPVPLVSRVDDIDEESPPPTFPTPLTRELDPSETRDIVAKAKSQGVTVNDLLIRDLFLAVSTWRKRRDIGSEGEWLRFSIPMNLRTQADATMPMANSISSVFLDREAGDFSDPDRLLQSIHEQMRHIKQLQLQYTFILSLAVARYVPGHLSRETRADSCRFTTWMSNLGPVLNQTPLPRREGRIVSGNVVLESVDYVIPLRPNLNAAFCVYAYAGRLRVLMHFDPRALTEEQSKELLEAYIRQIRLSSSSNP